MYNNCLDPDRLPTHIRDLAMMGILYLVDRIPAVPLTDRHDEHDLKVHLKLPILADQMSITGKLIGQMLFSDPTLELRNAATIRDSGFTNSNVRSHITCDKRGASARLESSR